MVTTVSRAERVRECRELREQGLLLREIGERLGLAQTTVHAYLDDPDGSKMRARKDSYRGRCSECGGPTTGCNGAAKAPTLCKGCIEWTRDECLEAVLAYFDECGYPPRVPRHPRDEGLPSEAVAARLFGGWNALLLAAGLPLACDRRAGTQEEIEARLRAGDRVADIAADLGCTEKNIYMRMRTRGVTVSSLRPDWFAGTYGTGSPERTARIVEMYREGFTFVEIAAEVGGHPRSVSNLLTRLRRRGVDIPYRRRPAA